MAELDDAARIPLENEDHPATDLRGRHRHMVLIQSCGLKSAIDDDGGMLRCWSVDTRRKRKQPLNLAFSLTSVKLGDYRLQSFPDIVGYDALTAQVRMHS